MSTQIQQAIFTSTDRGAIKGYQLVAMSDGIDRNLARELYRWSPSQLENDDPAKWTINYHPVTENSVAVTRTVLGGPEYSARGGAQVVTMIALLSNEQFAKFDNHAILFAQTSLALGWLRLPTEIPSRLEAFSVPDYAFEPSNKSLSEMGVSEGSAGTSSPGSEGLVAKQSEAACVQQAYGLVSKQQRLAIIGARCPLRFVEALISHLPVAQRRDFSFTTGLPPATHRPFQAHFLPESNRVLKQMFKSEGIELLYVDGINSDLQW